MEQRLDESHANIIRNAIRSDNFSVGSEPWCEEHNVTPEQFEAFLEFAVECARMRDFKVENADVGAVDVEMAFTTHSGKVGSTEEKWAVFIPQHYTTEILRVAEHGKVIATIAPERIALPVGTVLMDDETGELLS